MADMTRNVPDGVYQAADQAWNRWGPKIEAAPRKVQASKSANHWSDPNEGLSHEERMIRKIRRRMEQYPEWYETDGRAFSRLVCTELDRIGALLTRELCDTAEAVDVWDVPMSVFNWIETDEAGEHFVRGALFAWSRAEAFNAANGRELDAEQKACLRQPFMEIAPPLLKVVTEELLKGTIRVSFGKKFIGPELKFLVLRVQCPPD